MTFNMIYDQAFMECDMKRKELLHKPNFKW